MYDALILKICFRVSANVVRAPATCRYGHISTFEWIYVYCTEWNRIYHPISRFCLSPAPREEIEVSNVLSSLRSHLHKGLLFVHMQIWFYYYIACIPQRSGLVPSDKPPAYRRCD
jgi:hypothetical protein